MAVEEETPVLESALERFRERDTLRRSGKGTPLARFARGVSDGVPEQISLEGFIKSSLVLPPSLVVGLIAGLGKIGGNFASLARLVDQKKVDKFFAVANADWAETTAKFVGDDDPAAKRAAGLMTTVGTAGGGMVSYAVPAIGFARIFNQAFKVRPLIATLYADALVGFGGMSPEEENIFNLAKEASEKGDRKTLAELGSILATDPNSPEFVNRLRNAGEAILMLGISEEVIRGFKKLARAVKKGNNTAKTIDAIKKELPPEQADKLEQILEPDPKNPKKLGATVDEVEEITGKSVEEKPDPIDTQTDELLTDAEKKLAVQEKFNLPTDSDIEKETVDKLMKSIEDGLPIGADDLDTVVNTKRLDEPLDNEDAFPTSTVDPKGQELENLEQMAKNILLTSKVTEPTSSELKYLKNESVKHDNIDPNSNLGKLLSSISKDFNEPDPKFKKEFDKKAKEIQQQIDDAKIKLEAKMKLEKEIEQQIDEQDPDLVKTKTKLAAMGDPHFSVTTEEIMSVYNADILKEMNEIADVFEKGYVLSFTELEKATMLVKKSEGKFVEPGINLGNSKKIRKMLNEVKKIAKGEIKNEDLSPEHQVHVAESYFSYFVGSHNYNAEAGLSKYYPEEATTLMKKTKEQKDVQIAEEQLDQLIEEAKEAKIKPTTPSAPEMQEFKVTGKKPGGSSDGAEITDTATGIKYIAKYPKNIEQAAQEALASRVYQLAGVYTPEVKVITATVDGEKKTMLVSEFIEDLTPYNPDTVSPMEIGRLHATAAILKDWDAVGLSKDNIVFVTLPNGQTRLAQIDAGGSLEFRAQGEFKDGEFNSKAIEDWESLTDPKLGSLVYKEAYAKDSIAYMKGVEDALIRLSRIPEGTLYSKEVGSYASAGIDSTKDLSKVITDRIENLKSDLEEAIDMHGGIAIPTTAPPVEGVDAVIKDATFEPSTKNLNKIDEKEFKDQKAYIKRRISRYINLPETKAKKLGFDPSTPVTRYEQYAGIPGVKGSISATTLKEEEFVKEKTSEIPSDVGVGNLQAGSKLPTTPVSKDTYVGSQIKDVYDAERKDNLNFKDENTLSANMLIKGNFQALQSRIMAALPAIKNADKTLKLMLDPHGGKHSFSNFKGKERTDEEAYGRHTGVFYAGPALNNAFIFKDGITTKEVTKVQEDLDLAIMDAVQGPKDGTPIKFLTLGKSINFHVPSNIMGSTLPLNPNYKELKIVYDNIKTSITDLKTTPSGKDIIEAYADLIFANAYGSKMARALKSPGLSSTVIPEGRITKFDYSPTTPQGKKQYKEFFGDKWLEEASLPVGQVKIKGWSETESHGEAINIFLTSLNKGAKSPDDVYLTVPVADEVTDNYISYSKKSNDKGITVDFLGRPPFAQATLSPVQAKDVVKEASPKVKTQFYVDEKYKYISTIKPVVFKDKKPNEIDSKKSALFNSNAGLNVMKQYLGPIAVGASFIPMFISDEAEAEEVTVGLTEEEELGFTPVMDETVSDKLLTGGMMPEEQPVEVVGEEEEETPLASFPATGQEFSYEDVIQTEEDNDELDIDAQMNDLNLGEQVDDGQFNYVQ